MPFDKEYVSIDQLDANRYKVSAQKYGFFLCCTGEAEVLLGTQTYRISPNYLCIYTPNSFLHIITKSENLSGVMMQGPIDEYYSAVSTIDIRERLKMRNTPCVIISQREADSIIQLTKLVKEQKRLIEEGNYTKKETMYTIRMHHLHDLQSALCMQIFDIYFSNAPVQAQTLSRTDLIFNKFLISAYKNCHRERTVRFYADEQHLSPSYFSNIIRNRSGRSVMQWIEEITMTFAKQLLECTDDSIKEIADKLHFPDQSTFGRYFKKRLKIPPTDYRAKNKR